MVYVCFSSPLQVINKVMNNAVLIEVAFIISIEIILLPSAIKMEKMLYKQIIKLSLGKYTKILWNTNYWLLSSSVFEFLAN